MTKAELRANNFARQKSITPAERAALSTKIADIFFANFDLSAAAVVHCFLPIEKFNEVDTAPIFERLWAEFPGIATVVPRVDFETGLMESVAYAGGAELLRNRWGISEPASGRLVGEPEIDLVIVPGVAFDAGGHRVGYGKGFYDRFLPLCRPDCVKIGVSFFEPVAEVTDVHAGDVRVDFCVTPQGVFAARE